LSPPWGGTEYIGIGKRGYDIKSCIKLQNGNPKICTKECEKNDNDKFDNPKVTDQFVNGEDILLAAANASRQRVISYFLPRNIN